MTAQHLEAGASGKIAELEAAIEMPGERAFIAWGLKYGELHPERDMLLLYEDHDKQKRVLNLPERTYAISIEDFLRTIERTQIKIATKLLRL